MTTQLPVPSAGSQDLIELQGRDPAAESRFKRRYAEPVRASLVAQRIPPQDLDLVTQAVLELALRGVQANGLTDSVKVAHLIRWVCHAVVRQHPAEPVCPANLTRIL